MSSESTSNSTTGASGSAEDGTTDSSDGSGNSSGSQSTSSSSSGSSSGDGDVTQFMHSTQECLHLSYEEIDLHRVKVLSGRQSQSHSHSNYHYNSHSHSLSQGLGQGQGQGQSQSRDLNWRVMKDDINERREHDKGQSDEGQVGLKKLEGVPVYWSDKSNSVEGGEINQDREESRGRERGSKMEDSGDTDNGHTEESYQDDYDNNDLSKPSPISLQTDSSSSKNVPQASSDLGRRSDHRASKYSLSRYNMFDFHVPATL